MQATLESEVVASPVLRGGAKDATMKILVGTEDGSWNITMRLVRLSRCGHTPRDCPGDCVFVAPNKRHQFANPLAEPFELMCFTPSPNTCCVG